MRTVRFTSVLPASARDTRETLAQAQYASLRRSAGRLFSARQSRLGAEEKIVGAIDAPRSKPTMQSYIDALVGKGAQPVLAAG
jgi:hypothetical protein